MGLVISSAAVLLYSCLVLYVVATMGDIGIECVFGTRIQQSIDSHDYQWTPAAPNKNDRLLSVGPRKIAHYTDYVDVLRGLKHQAGQRVEVRWRTPKGEVRQAIATVRLRPFRTYVGSLIWFLQELIIFAIGARVYWKRPKDDSARLFFWLCIVTVGAYMGGYHWYAIVVSLPLIYFFPLFAVFVPIVSLHFYLVFPRVHPLLVSRRRLVLWVLYGVPSFFLALIWVGITWTHLAKGSGDGSVEIALRLLRSISLGYLVLAALIFGLCLLRLGQSYIQAQTRSERIQVKWILLASLLASLLIASVLWQAWYDVASLAREGASWKMFAVSLLYTLAYAVSITRYSSVSLAAGLLYSGAVVLSAAVVGANWRDYGSSFEAKVGAAAAMAVLILAGLVRERFQRAIDRRFHREKYKFDKAMKKMSQAVGSLVDRELLGQRLLEAAGEVLRIDWGAVYLREYGQGPMALAACLGPEPEQKTLGRNNPLVVRLEGPSAPKMQHAIAFAASPDPATDAMIALGGELASPLVQADGELAGLIVLGPKPNGMPYEEEEIAFLGALGSVATLALHSTEIQRTLRDLEYELREKVDKIAEQQRRILILQNQVMEQGERFPTTFADPGLGDLSAFEEMKGSSESMRKLMTVARKVAMGPSAVLIRGESGTGKERLAEAIHRASPRREGPFVKVHCAALSQTLLESELFGHVKGAFTGADRDRMGRFQQADGGTLFLDEIGDINLEVQTKLLRVLQAMTFEKVGSSQSIVVDVRILAATHQDLEGLIRTGRFRSDLYYRLNVISLETPPLRERSEDVFELAIHFLKNDAERIGKAINRIDEDALECLIRYDWPGNIRELENVIERAVVLADGPNLTRDDLPSEILGYRRRGRKPPVAVRLGPAGHIGEFPPAGEAWTGSVERTGQPSAWQGDAAAEPLDEEFLAYERRRLIDALQDAHGNKSEAARLLAMPRSTFFSKLKKHGLA